MVYNTGENRCIILLLHKLIQYFLFHSNEYLGLERKIVVNITFAKTILKTEKYSSIMQHKQIVGVIAWLGWWQTVLRTFHWYKMVLLLHLSPSFISVYNSTLSWFLIRSLEDSFQKQTKGYVPGWELYHILVWKAREMLARNGTARHLWWTLFYCPCAKETWCDLKVCL